MRRYRGVAGSRRIRAAWASLGAGVCLLGAGACAGADADGARDDGGGRASPSAAERDGGVEQRPCARPEGGWIADPARTDASDLAAVTERARELDAYAGVWTAYIDQEELEGEGHPSTDPGNVIVAAAYTGDPAGHEAELRALWGGGLCLVEAEHTHEELDEVRDALADDFPGIDNPVVDQPDNVVSAVTAEITPELRAAVEERFGEGIVRLEEGEHEPARPN